jgi:2-pyrone-4,6-dicarboxylate lactonase
MAESWRHDGGALVAVMTPLPPPHPDPHPPRLFAMPALACDSHCHVFGPYDRYPLSPTRSYEPAEATLADYCGLQARLGLSRTVFVQPAAYGRDHSAMLDAIARQPGSFRGVGQIDSQTSGSDLAVLHRGGIRGARFNFVGHLGGASMAEVAQTAACVALLGWHIVLHVDGPALLAHADAIAALECPVVIDHMARLSAEAGQGQPAFQRLLALAAMPHVWTKISAGDRMVAGPQELAKAAPFMAALAAAAPARTLWGTDWPHPNIRFMPDDGDMADLLALAVPDAAARHAILVDNPAALYQFGLETQQ